jgi:membrane-associated protein
VVRSNIELMLLAIVGISVLPMAYEFLRERARRRRGRGAAPENPPIAAEEHSSTS